jgi:chromosome segregation ATPase
MRCSSTRRRLRDWNISRSAWLRCGIKLMGFRRLKFETAQLDGTRERLQRLRATVEKERHNLEDKLESDLEALQGEIREAEAQVKDLQQDLEDLEKDVEEKSAAVSAIRKEYNKASRALDEVSKDISGWVSAS